MFDALIELWSDTERRNALGRAAAEFVRLAHAPSRIGDAYFDAIERFARKGRAAATRALIDSAAAIAAPVTPSDGDLEQFAANILANQEAKAPHQILIDVSSWVDAPADTGRTQAADALLNLILSPPSGFRTEPFYLSHGVKRYARHFALRLLG